METIYLCFVVFLFVLAVFDLSVGVSNDAVNFLNSAVGAKAAKFRTVIIIAAVGIFCGAAMSNGMMEIARHGIFRPEQFYLNELMCIFLTVMVTDIVLLDIFNSLGMPTSTTVSLVFELLGATFALAIFKLVGDETGLLSMANLLNTEKALSVIMGIFVSVAIAFFFGTLVQFISRILFKFNYKPGLSWKIGIFGGIAATAIIYFMLIKGIKDLTIMSPELKTYINENTLTIVGGCFVFFTILMQILHFCKVNVFKVVVLMGTFALAMAFAGNDLVNFIGVPLAGYASYLDWMANGAGDPGAFLMGSLNGPAKTEFIFLFVAGIIMVISLLTSKKAHNVIKTSVDLARQDAGDEMFGSSRMARTLVRTSTTTINGVLSIIPSGVKRWVNSRFDQDNIILENGAAFDLVRASVNLVLAGLLIAVGTSLKLPLSTTYVTFMVAMGTSLADRAWSRESAVFRITGVISVIGGWFITAGAAFILAFFVVLIMYYGGTIGTIAMIILGLALLVRSHIKYSKKKEAEKAEDDLFQRILASQDKQETRLLLNEHVAKSQVEYVGYAGETYLKITDAFINEDYKTLHKASVSLKNRKVELKKIRRKEMLCLRRIDKDLAIEKNTWFHLASNSTRQMIYCLRRIVDPCEEHVDNHFSPITQEQVKEFIPLRDTLIYLMNRSKQVIADGNYEEVDALRSEYDKLKEVLSRTRKLQMNRMQDEKDNLAASYVYLNMIQESQELVSALRHLLRAARSFQA